MSVEKLHKTTAGRWKENDPAPPQKLLPKILKTTSITKHGRSQRIILCCIIAKEKVALLLIISRIFYASEEPFGEKPLTAWASNIP